MPRISVGECRPSAIAIPSSKYNFCVSAILTGSAFVVASLMAPATAFAGAKGGGGMGGAFGGAMLPPVKLAALAKPPAGEAGPAASAGGFAAARFSSLGAKIQRTAALQAAFSGSERSLPQACCRVRQPHQMASRGASAWQRKSMPARYCLFVSRASKNARGDMPFVSRGLASFLRSKFTQTSAAVAALILTRGELDTKQFSARS